MEKDKNVMQIPYIVYESSMSRSERIIKNLISALILCIILLFISNALWLQAWSQYDYTDDSISVDSGDGIANYIGEDGEINNGTNNSEKENNDTQIRQ